MLCNIEAICPKGKQIEFKKLQDIIKKYNPELVEVEEPK